jgi:class 3 adenylate cyclase
MASFSRPETAARAGVADGYVDDLVAAGLLKPDALDELTMGDVRRIGLIRSLQEAGIPLDGLAAGLERGVVALDFVDSEEYERFAGLGTETFEEVSTRTGVPLPLLTMIREAIGLGTARPTDLVRDDELAVVPFVEAQFRLGFRAAAIERVLRAMGENLRRFAEAEAEWWRSEVIDPRLAAGGSPADVVASDVAIDLTRFSQDAMVAVFHAQEAQTWTANIIASFEYQLAEAGLHRAQDRPPAICFLDITGYTRLTQERGDQAAAELAESLARLVKRTSTAHGGRPVKWLGDGVMFHFRDPGPAVVAALEMVVGILEAGLPPAHVGVHTGPVVLQDGDYYGQTVNLAARIAEYARPGEVLVSQAVIEAADCPDVAFTDIGAVELKGVSGAMRLHSARSRAAVSA